MNLSEPQLRQRFLWKDLATAQTLIGPIAGPSSLFDLASAGTLTVTTSLVSTAGTTELGATIIESLRTNGLVNLSAGATVTGDLVVTGKVRSAQTGDLDDLGTLVTRQYLDQQLLNFATGGTGGADYPENGVVTFSYANVLYTTQTTTLIVVGSSTLGSTTASSIVVQGNSTLAAVSATTVVASGSVTGSSGSFGPISGSTIHSSGLASLHSLNVSNSSNFSSIVVSGTSQLGALSAGASTLSSLNVTNGTSLGGNLGVVGTGTFASIVSTSNASLSALSVSSAATFSSTVSTGGLTSSSVTSSGQGSFGTLQSSGLATLHSASITNGISLNTLTVSGASSFGSTLGVSGLLSGTSADFSSSLSALGNTSLSTLSTSGLATLHSASVTNKITSASTLASDPQSTLVTLGFVQSTFLPLTGGILSTMSITNLLSSGSFSTGSASIVDLTVSGSAGFVSGSFSSNVSVNGNVRLLGSTLSDPSFTSVSSGARLLLSSASNDINAIGMAAGPSVWISSASAIRLFTDSQVAATFGADGSLALRAGLSATTVSSSAQASLSSLVVSGSTALQNATATGWVVSGTSQLQSVTATTAALTSATLSSTLAVNGLASLNAGASVSGSNVSIAGGQSVLFSASGSKVDFGSVGGLAAPAVAGSVGARVLLNGNTNAVGVESGYTWIGSGGGFKFYNVSASPSSLLSIESNGNAVFLGSLTIPSASVSGNLSTATFSTGSATITNALGAGSLSSGTLVLTGKAQSASTIASDAGTTLATKDFVLPVAGGTLSGALAGTSAAFSSAVSGSSLLATAGEMSVNVGTGSTSLNFRLANDNRFRIVVGQDLEILSYSNLAVLLSPVPLSIARLTGLVTIPSLSSTSAAITTLTAGSVSSTGSGTFVSGSFGSVVLTGSATLPTIQNNVSFTNTGSAALGSLTVTNASQFNSNVTVTGSTSLFTLSTSSLATLHSASVTNGISGGSLSVSGASNISSLVASGSASVNSLSVATTTLLSGFLTVSSGISSTSLSVTGTSGISTTVLSSSSLASLQSLSVSTTSTFSGAITANAISAGRVSSSNTVFALTDLVTRSYVESNFASVSNTLSLSGTLTVQGSSSFSTISSSGLSTLQSLSVSGSSVLAGLTAAGASFSSISNSGTSALTGLVTSAGGLFFSSTSYSDPSLSNVSTGTRINFGSANQISVGLSGSASSAFMWHNSNGGFVWNATNINSNTITPILTITGTAASFSTGLSVASLSTLGTISGGASTLSSLLVPGAANFGNGNFSGTLGVTGVISATAGINSTGKITAISPLTSDSVFHVITKGYAESNFLALSGGSISGTLTAANINLSGILTILGTGSIVSTGTINSQNGLIVSSGTTSTQALSAVSVTTPNITVTNLSTLSNMNLLGTATMVNATVSSAFSAVAGSFSGKITCSATLDSSDVATTVITKGFADSRYFITSGNTLQVGYELSGYRTVAIKLYGDPFYTDYSLQLSRIGLPIGGGNYGTSRLDHRGTGELMMGCQDAGSLGLYTANVTRMLISPSGVISVSGNFVVTGEADSTFSNLSSGIFTASSGTFTSSLQMNGNISFSSLGKRIDFGTGSGNLAAPSLTSPPSQGTRLTINSHLNAIGAEIGSVWMATDAGFKIYRNDGTSLLTMFSLLGTGSGNATFSGSVISQSGTSQLNGLTVTSGLTVSSGSLSAPTIVATTISASSVTSTGTSSALLAYDRTLANASDFVSITRTSGVTRISDSGALGTFLTFTPSSGQLGLLSSAVSSTSITVNGLGTGFRNAFVNLVGSDANPEYGLRLERAGSGLTDANAIPSFIRHRGLSALRLVAEDAGSVELATTNMVRMTVASNGDINIPGRILVTGANDSQFANLSVTNFSATNFSLSNFSPPGNLVFATSGSYIDFQAGLASPVITGAGAGTKVLLSSFTNSLGAETGNVWLSSSGGFKLYRNTGSGGAVTTLLTVSSTGNGDVSLNGSLSAPSATLSGLTASRLMASDASKGLVSVATLSSWVAGTSNQVLVANDGDGTITLSAPQNIHTGASPTFLGASFTNAPTVSSVAVALTSRSITATGLLTGGGDLSADRTITLANTAQNVVIGRAAGGLTSDVPTALSTPMVSLITSSNASAARTVLGLGTISTQESSSVAITGGTASLTSITVSDLTAIRLLASNASKGLVSVANLATWIGGTANRVTVADDNDGTITLSTPQDIHTGATPTFAGASFTNAPTVSTVAVALTSRSINATGLLTGGGTLAADRTITLATTAQNVVIGRAAGGLTSDVPTALSTPMIGIITAATASAARTVLGLGTIATQASSSVTMGSATVDSLYFTAGAFTQTSMAVNSVNGNMNIVSGAGLNIRTVDQVNRISIDAAGALTFGATSSTFSNAVFAPSLQFSSSSTALSDYEEGTWTPRVRTFGPTEVTYTTSVLMGFYTKINTTVIVFGDIRLTNITNSATYTKGYSLYISDLPFPARTYNAAGCVGFSNGWTTASPRYIYVAPGFQYPSGTAYPYVASLYGQTSATATGVTSGDYLTNTSNIFFTLTYRTDL